MELRYLLVPCERRSERDRSCKIELPAMEGKLQNDAQEETISIEQLFARTDRQAGSFKQAQP